MCTEFLIQTSHYLEDIDSKMSFYRAVLVTIFIIGISNARVLKKNVDTCQEILGNDLIEEIRSYENVKDEILNYVLNGDFKHKTYNELEMFVDKFGARPSGSQVLEDSIDYMIELTREEGFNDIVTEDVVVPNWQRGQERLTMLEPRIKAIEILGLGFSISTPAEGITAEVIVFNNFDELEKTPEKQIKGKIVLYSAIFTTYSETVQYRTQGAAKAAAKGAVATLVRSIAPFSINSPHTGYQSYKDGIDKIPTAAISLEDADLIKRIYNRGDKVVLNIQMTSTYDTQISRNTLIDIKGTQNPEKVVIVSAHIDSWDIGQGAMDDGDGVFMTWAVPVILKRLNLTPRRTLKTIFWTAEEYWLFGAYAFEEAHRDELDNVNIVLEIDQSSFAPRGLAVSGNEKTKCMMAEILKLFESINATTVVDLPNPGTDVAVFTAKGMPAALYYNNDEKYYWFHHTAGDTMNVLDRDEIDLGAAFWTAVTYIIADLSLDIPR